MPHVVTATAATTSATRPIELNGWRKGRPVEDPAKLKRWGFITARPSEYLVHMRRGVVRTRSSGQGATCFKWPRDSVAVVPTSLQRLAFRADQVTQERVGVEVVGLCVYRIAEPLLAARLLNFSFPERAQQKLEETLAAMCVAATRRLVANLALDDCLSRRKAAIADELVRELAPVVGGMGRADDWTVQGWGIVVDTVEIQEVRVLSEAVFSSMQAPFRAELERRATEARLDAEQRGALKEAEARRVVEAARLTAEVEVRSEQQRAALEKARLDAEEQARKAALERETKERLLEEEASLRRRQEEIARLDEDATLEEALLRLERERTRAQAEQALLEIRLRSLEAEAQLAAQRRELDDAERRHGAGLLRVEGEAKAEVALLEARAAKERAEAEAKVLVARRLPEIAGALASDVGELKLTQIGGDAQGALLPAAGALKAVLDVVRSA